MNADGTDTAITPTGKEVPVRYKVVEGDKLIASQRDDMTANSAYPKELQPRDRARYASQQQISKIANELNPRLLMDNPLSSEGAPVVGSDGVVESGNGRVLAMRKAYADGLAGAEKYRQALEKAGYDTTGMKNPILVRERASKMTDQERVKFAQESNQRTTAAMSAPEQAKVDASRLSSATLDKYVGGDITRLNNRSFFKSAIKDMIPANEHNAIFDQHGSISQDAQRRVNAALLHKAYDDEGINQLLTENTDNELTSLGKALSQAAPKWASMRDMAQKGEIPSDLDITQNIVDATHLILKARREDMPLPEMLKTFDMFSGAVDPITVDIVEALHTNPKMTRFNSADKITDFFTRYADNAQKANNGKNLFGEAPLKSKEILENSRRKAFGDGQGTG